MDEPFFKIKGNILIDELRDKLPDRRHTLRRFSKENIDGISAYLRENFPDSTFDDRQRTIRRLGYNDADDLVRYLFTDGGVPEFPGDTYILEDFDTHEYTPGKTYAEASAWLDANKDNNTNVSDIASAITDADKYL